MNEDHNNGADKDEPGVELTIQDLFATIGRLEVTRAALVDKLAASERENAGLRAIAEAQQRRIQVLESDEAIEEQTHSEQ